jgi:pimeloyl-ACP methyl ester carboxylesterase
MNIDACALAAAKIRMTNHGASSATWCTTFSHHRASVQRCTVDNIHVYAQSLLALLAARYGIHHRNDTMPLPIPIAAHDGLHLNVLDWQGPGETIIFLHGGALTAHSWDLVCLGLRDEWRCLALDMRGHGDSGWADEYRIETAVHDVATLVADQQLNRVHLVGNSLGGLVAVHCAATHPDFVASLTLVDVGPNVDFAATQPIRDYIEHTDGLENFAAAIAAGMRVNPRIDREALEYRLLHSMREGADQRVYWKQDRRRMHDYDYFMGKIAEIERLAPAITCDVLVARGARSRVFSDASARDCAESFARGRWVRIEDSGHNIQEANPAGFIASLREFLASIPKR